MRTPASSTRDGSKTNPGKGRLALILAVLVLAAIETLGFAGVAAVSYRVRPRLIWAPDLDRFEAGYDRFLATHDPLLGWPPKGDARFDDSGARHLPAFPRPARSCISLFGDSFTFAADVSDAEAWANWLAQRLGCRVASYGVPGYGTDQALLRFSELGQDESEVVVLGIFEDNLQRNVNRYRALLVGEPEAFSFKPRFKLNDRGELQLVPLRFPSTGEISDFLSDPARFLDDESFLPGSRAGPVRSTSPYLLTAAKIFLHPDIQARLRGRQEWERFYQPGHPSGALEVSIEIVEVFRQEAYSRGQEFLVLLFPSPRTLQGIETTDLRPYQPLLDRLVALGFHVEDVSIGMLSRLDGRSPCEIAMLPRMCRGHFDQEGNRWVADIVFEALVREGLVPGGTP